MRPGKNPEERYNVTSDVHKVITLYFIYIYSLSYFIMICLESGGVSGICETRRLRRNGYTSVCGIDLKSVHLSFILFDRP